MIGYFGEMLILILISEVYLLISGVLLLLFISMCIHHRTFYEILKRSVDKWNDNISISTDDKQFLCNLIRFHVSSKEYVEQNDNTELFGHCAIEI